MKHLNLTLHLTALIALSLGMSTPSLLQAQESQTLEAQDLNAPVAEAAPTSNEEWWAFSRNDRLVYLIDIKAVSAVGDATAVRIARLAAQGPGNDLSYKVDEYQIRCRGNQARILQEIEYDDKGVELDRYPEPNAEWETIRPSSLSAHFKQIVCEQARPEGPPAPSLQAFVARGRK